MKTIGHLLFTVGVLFCSLNGFASSPSPSGSSSSSPSFSTSSSEPGPIDLPGVVSPSEFTDFLQVCSLEERIALMQSLRGLDRKIGPHCYGKLKGLKTRQSYTEDRKKVSDTLPLLPKTYNDASPETVVDAIEKGHLGEDLFSVPNIKRTMVWRRYNKVNYVFHEKEDIDYHSDYVMWAAAKCGIDKDKMTQYTTFELEQEIFKKHFEKIWDKLSVEQRMKLLSKMESQNGSVGNKVAIASMTGAAAISSLSVTVACTGFAFYTSLTSAMAVAAGWVGVTLPFAAYTSATTTVAILTGPIGWGIAGTAVVGGGIAAGWPDKDLIISFVMMVNTIKAKRYVQ